MLRFFLLISALIYSVSYGKEQAQGSNDDQVSEEEADMKIDESQKSENGTDKEGKLSYATGYTG